MGEQHLDICFQQRHLISGVDLKLRLIRAKDTFCLVGDGQYKVKLKDVAVSLEKHDQATLCDLPTSNLCKSPLQSTPCDVWK